MLFQAEIAHDLLARGVRLEQAAASLWVLGFQVPFQVVRLAFENQIAGYYLRAGAKLDDNLTNDDLEERLWQLSQWFARADARVRQGSIRDGEGEALLSFTGEMLSLLFGVGDDSAEDTATEILTHTEVLKPITEKRWPANKVPDLQAIPPKDIKEAISWIRDMLSLRRQREAVADARDHDWVRARRIARLAIGTFARGNTMISTPVRHKKNYSLFGRMAAGYGRLLFPVLLSITRNDEERQKIVNTLFTVVARVRQKRNGRRVKGLKA